ncbi:helix-turn-helix domain-containing protein [Oleiharenicola lentus]|uniref:helix-turn-helix domain-containing protein n=1 Tax=Oleiharenicola lentus TaxID=2508720 RepID=UPI003F663526
MQHARLFRQLREQRGLTLDALATLARRHRNTIINLENGRPVKFPTIARLMEKMGHPANSPEMAHMALLWVESISGLDLSMPDKGDEAPALATYQRSTQKSVAGLTKAIRRAGLDEREIRLLEFAASRPAVLGIIDSVLTLLQNAEQDSPALKAAEDK